MEEPRAFLRKQRQMKQPGRPKTAPARDEDVRVDPTLLDNVFVAKSFQDMPYRWLEPESLEEGRRYPLLLVLHGAGGKGNDNRKNLGGIGHGSSGPAMTYRGDNKDRGWITQMTSAACDPEPNVWDWLFGQRRSADR